LVRFYNNKISLYSGDLWNATARGALVILGSRSARDDEADTKLRWLEIEAEDYSTSAAFIISASVGDST
jgi:hypothetical protein